MKKARYTCICCLLDKAPEHYAPGTETCHECRTLTVDIALKTAKAYWEHALAVKNGTKDGRKALRRERRLAQHERDGGKRCTSCHGRKPFNAFKICEARGDGLQSECAACMKMRATILASPGGNMGTWRTVRDAMRATAATPAAGPASAGTPNAV